MPEAGREERDAGLSRATDGVPLDQYRLMFERNPHPMWVYDLDTLGFLAVNDAAVVHYGYSRAEFLGMTIRDIRPAEAFRPWSRTCRSMSWAAVDWRPPVVGRHRTRHGAIIEVEITSHELAFAGRRGKVVLAHDVTERGRAERAQEAQLAVAAILSESSTVEEAGERLLGALARAFGWAVGAVWLVDPERRVLRCDAFSMEAGEAPARHPQFEPALRSVGIAPGAGLPGAVWDSARRAHAETGHGTDTRRGRGPCAAHR